MLYVSMYTRILISEVSVFRMFTYKPINGLSIKHQLNIGCYRISPYACKLCAILWDFTYAQAFFVSACEEARSEDIKLVN